MEKKLCLLVVLGYASFADAAELRMLRRTYSMHSTVEDIKRAISTNNLEAASRFIAHVFPTGLHAQFNLLVLARSPDMCLLLLERIYREWNYAFDKDPESTPELFNFGFRLIEREKGTRPDVGFIEMIALLKEILGW